MNAQHRHIILMGFKHVGKSAIGYQLASKLNRKFFDLDQHIEYLYFYQSGRKVSCRKITEFYGEHFFRNLENKALHSILDTDPAVISLGGGTPIYPANQALLKPHILAYILAPQDLVFKRIMDNGVPSFFPANQNHLHFFNRLWQQRAKIYNSLADFSVNNYGSLDHAVADIINQLSM